MKLNRQNEGNNENIRFFYDFKIQSNMKEYLKETAIINFSNKEVYALVIHLASEYVCDKIHHSGDYNEFDLCENLSDPLPVVVETLRKYNTYDEMICHFPDVEMY